MMRLISTKRLAVLLCMFSTLSILSAACGGSALTPQAGGTASTLSPTPAPANSQPTSTPQASAAPPVSPHTPAAAVSEQTATSQADGEPPTGSPTPQADSGKPTATPQSLAPPPTAAPTEKAASIEPTGTPPTKVTIDDEDILYGPGDFDLADPAAGLEDLVSYQARLTLQFEGTIKGQPAARTFVMVLTKNPQARQVTIEGSRGTLKLDPVRMIEMDGASYEIKGQEPCTVQQVKQGSSLADQFEPALSLDVVFGAEKAGSETVNGTTADHFTFDQRALGEDGVSQSRGEMWVAPRGGYVVKYLLTRKGGADYFGEGIEGTETFDYESNVPGDPVAVEIPASCPAVLLNAPLLPDAANINKSIDLLTYESATAVPDAVAFFQKELPKRGWAQAADPFSRGAAAMLRYKKGNQELTVILTAKEGGGTTVNIRLDPSGE